MSHASFPQGTLSWKRSIPSYYLIPLSSTPETFFKESEKQEADFALSCSFIGREILHEVVVSRVVRPRLQIEIKPISLLQVDAEVDEMRESQFWHTSIQDSRIQEIKHEP